MNEKLPKCGKQDEMFPNTCKQNAKFPNSGKQTADIPNTDKWREWNKLKPAMMRMMSEGE